MPDNSVFSWPNLLIAELFVLVLTVAVILTLSSQGTTDAVVMLVIVILANGLLQNIVQPIAFGATLDLNPLVVLIVTIGAVAPSSRRDGRQAS